MDKTFIKRLGWSLFVLFAVFGAYALGVRTGQGQVGNIIKVEGVSAQVPPAGLTTTGR